MVCVLVFGLQISLGIPHVESLIMGMKRVLARYSRPLPGSGPLVSVVLINQERSKK